MRRTQIYLPEDLHRKLREQSQRKNISLSELVRRRMSFRIVSPARDGRAILNDLTKVGEKLSWKGAPKDLSQRIDEFVYD